VDLSWVILRPRITEKGAVISETSNAYTFDVHKDATKTLVKEAIKEMYNVEPVKVNVVVMARKKIERQRGRARKVGLKGGGKKAFVFLKKGDQIQFV
jgi:large subunit ribosomal protein L23